MLTAISRLAQDPPPGMPTIIMACSVDEEYGFSGARKIPDLWEGETSGLLSHRPDAVIVTEPTQLNVVVAHKGTLRWRCHTRGCAAHSAHPNRGRNAIYYMAHVLAAFEAYASDVVPNLGEHSLVGRPTLSVGLISGGISVNTVPDYCVIEIDRLAAPRRGSAGCLGACKGVRIGRRPRDGPVGTRSAAPGPSWIAGRRQWRSGPSALRDGAQERGIPAECVGVPYGTDAPVFAGKGPATVVFGPGSLDQARHTVDEWIEIDALHVATEVLCDLVRRHAAEGRAQR